nr:acetylornithine transaminase [Brachybacterium sillae]
MPAPDTLTPDAPAQDLPGRYVEAMIPVFGTPQRVLVRGEGSRVWDDAGREYLDLLGGIAVNTLGHAHPAIVGTLTTQATTLMHASNFFATPPQVELAETLLQLVAAPAGSGVFFANSGAEANEAAFKLARRTGRPRILALEDAFHGRTVGALGLTHKAAYREPFAPLAPGVSWVRPGDLAQLEQELAGGDVAALIVEPIQGEAGVVPVDPDYLRAARHLTRDHGTLLILDEVQTGIGRTGEWFAHQALGRDGGEAVVPDAVTVAKGLGGGFPIGALIALGSEVKGLLQQGQHGTTFGGNALAAAVALAVLHTVREEGLLQAATERGAQIVQELRGAHPVITAITGAGLLRGVQLSAPVAPRVVELALEAGLILNAPRPTTLRLAPALTITEAEIQRAVSALPGLIDRALAEQQPATAGATDERSH